MIAFLGPAGTFTETAAKNAFADLSPETFQPMASIPAVLEAVAQGHVSAGVVPMENSIQGTVHVTIDGLLSHPRLEIVEEVLLRIEQHLMVTEQTRTDQVTEVWSHPQALAQCRAFILDRGLCEVQFDSTAAAAAELAKQQRTDVAVIGPKSAATEHGLSVVQSDIADVSENWTRFAVVRINRTEAALPGVAPTEKNATHEASRFAQQDKKTMLVVIPYGNFPGVLASILNVFATLGLNLCWIESRPTRLRLGTYQFFVEIQTGTENDSLQTAISVLEAYGHGTRVLGSYERSVVSS
ncbi:prephenate dehydratase [Alicyclobacillus ferrooxydans]|nr:prephenate dehydratase [Alicyclobacillus ferrooxydans]